jgi:hypothetical protein
VIGATNLYVKKIIIGIQGSVITFQDNQQLFIIISQGVNYLVVDFLSGHFYRETYFSAQKALNMFGVGARLPLMPARSAPMRSGPHTSLQHNYSSCKYQKLSKQSL